MKGTLISSVVLVAIVLASSFIVISLTMPTLERASGNQDISEAKQIMTNIESAVSALDLESSGSSRSMKISTDAGKLIISGKEDRIKFYLENEIKMFEPGTRFREGNLIISSGPSLKAYEADIDNDGDMDLVMENGVLIFAIEKRSSEFINTSQMISLIKIKPDVIVVPKSEIIIDDVKDSSYGYGSTELTRTGENLPSAGIRLVMNSSSGINYEAIFTLGPVHDFVELEINHITG